MRAYLGLVHYPIVNKKGELVTTSVTNLDIHDISRSCKTFGILNYFIISPLKAQKELVNRILNHWKEDVSSDYNPDRHNALSIARFVESVQMAALEIEKIEGIAPKIVVTGANFKNSDGSELDLRSRIEIDKTPILLLFGTGWGLAPELVNEAYFKLGPITGPKGSDYNHLSVRSAVAIYLDRLFGQS